MWWYQRPSYAKYHSVPVREQLMDDASQQIRFSQAVVSAALVRRKHAGTGDMRVAAVAKTDDMKLMMVL
jgi:hypothetical protein